MDETNQNDSGQLIDIAPAEFEKPSRDVPPAAKNEKPGSLVDVVSQQPEKEITTDPRYLTDIGSEMSVGYMPEKQEKPKPDYPEAPTIADMPNLSTTVQFVSGLSDDPNLIARAILREHPETEYRIDSSGYPYIYTPPSEEGGKEGIYYLDKPGFNKLDAKRAFTRGAMALPTGIAAAGAFTAGPVAGTAAMGAAGAADAAIRQGILYGLTGEKTLHPSEIIGEGVTSAVVPWALTGAAKTIGWAGRMVDAENLYQALPKGVRNRLDALVSNAEKKGGIQAGSEVGDIILDDPNFSPAAKVIMKRDDAAAKQLEQSLMDREATTQSRIDGIIDRAFGKSQVTKNDVYEFLKGERNALQPDMDKALEDATQKFTKIDTSGVIAYIDKQLETAKGGAKSILEAAKRELTPNQQFQALTPAEQRIAYGSTPYESNPQSINNAIDAIRKTMRTGGELGGQKIDPSTLKGSFEEKLLMNIKERLEKQMEAIPGYGDVMRRYYQNNLQADAVNLGYNFAQKTPDQIQKFLAKNPELRPYVEGGARLRVEDIMKTSPDDLAQIKKLVKKEGDYTRDSLNTLFGKDNITKLAESVGVEKNRQAVTKELLDTLAEARADKVAGIMGEGKDTFGTLKDIGNLPLAAAKHGWEWFRGRTGEPYWAGMADLLTKNRSELDAILQARGVSQKEAREKLIEQLQQGAASSGALTPNVSYPFRDIQQADGGRIAYKSGGRVKNARAVAMSLLREIDQTRKMIGKKTEDILSMPDDAVATALTIARGNV